MEYKNILFTFIYLYKYVLVRYDMPHIFEQTEFVVLICFGILLTIASFASTGFASPQNETSIIPESSDSISGNNTGIVLVHGSWSDGSVWSKVIPILTEAGYKIVAAQLPLHSLQNDIDTAMRAVERIGGPAILVGHSYGGEVISNAGYNNPDVTGLVYIAALAPDEGETGTTFFETIPAEFSKTYFENIANDSAGFLHFNPEAFHESFAQDIDPAEAHILAIVQKPFNESIIAEASGPPAWKQLPTWYQISENDRLIPPDIQRATAERMNATTLSLNSSHMSPVSHPQEIANLIINATKVS
jgi:pimeloyl-ACP methyl ester carboxylesterase